MNVHDLLPLQLSCGRAAKIELVSPDGELLDTLFPPFGKRSASLILGRYPDDYDVILTDCAPQNVASERLSVMSAGSDHDSGANPTWRPSAGDQVKEMKALVAQIARSEQRVRRMLPQLTVGDKPVPPTPLVQAELAKALEPDPVIEKEAPAS